MELEHQNPAQTGQLNPLFHAFTDVVNRVVEVQQITDWLMPNSDFSPNGWSGTLARIHSMVSASLNQGENSLCTCWWKCRRLYHQMVTTSSTSLLTSTIYLLLHVDRWKIFSTYDDKWNFSEIYQNQQTILSNFQHSINTNHILRMSYQVSSGKRQLIT